MAIKVKKADKLQGNVDIAENWFIKVELNTLGLKDSEGRHVQKIKMSYYKDQIEFDALNAMYKPKGIPFSDFNILLTNEEMSSISTILVHDKVKEFLIDNTDSFTNTDLEIIL